MNGTETYTTQEIWSQLDSSPGQFFLNYEQLWVAIKIIGNTTVRLAPLLQESLLLPNLRNVSFLESYVNNLKVETQRSKNLDYLM